MEDLLTERNIGPIVGLARNPDEILDLADCGVEVRPFDYDRPETLATGLAGVDRLLLISSSAVGQRTRQHLAVIEAAKAGPAFAASSTPASCTPTPIR